ncbi:MAG TPA: hypothetical protein VK821_21265, partial [Dehalococcoidia bacterium]|nr:hypothetical protein [Dehalococcoidia bacterium]
PRTPHPAPRLSGPRESCNGRRTNIVHDPEWHRRLSKHWAENRARRVMLSQNVEVEDAYR